MAKTSRIVAALAPVLTLATCAPPRSAVDLEQPIGPLAFSGVALQVVVHDVLEGSPAGGAVRLCRSLIDVPIELRTSAPMPLGDVLRNLAEQAHTEFLPAALARDGEHLPTLRCSGEETGYLVIGRSPR